MKTAVSLVLMILVFSLIKIFVPNSSYQKYVNFIIGLVITLFILNAVMGFEIPDISAVGQGVGYDKVDIEKIEQEQLNLAFEMNLKEDFAKNVPALSNYDYYLKIKCKAEEFGAIEKLTIVSEDNIEDKETVMGQIRETYGTFEIVFSEDAQ